MPRSQKGHWCILCVIDEMTNYLITAALYQARSKEVGEALIENVISKFGMPEYMMMDQDSAFMSSLMSYLFKKLGISIKAVGLYNHKSLQAEHDIKSLSNILSKCLTGQGQTWHNFLSLATFAYNIFHTPNLGNYSLYELVFGRRPKILINIETDPDIKVSGHTQGLSHISDQKARLSAKHAAELQNEMLITFEQGQRLFSVQQWRFSLSNISIDNSIENII